MSRLRAAIFLLLASGCSSPGPERAPDIVWIVIDTLRADHLGCYGYAGETSPAIDAFAAGATVYSRAISSAPWTVPSHASMFTGKPPFAHGAHTFEVAAPSRNVDALREGALTFAEMASAEGYRTAGFVGNAGYLGPSWKLDQGFETWTVQRAPAVELNRSIFKWLDASNGQPYFLFVNYIDTHRPYNSLPEAPDNASLDALISAVLPGTGEVPPGLVRDVIRRYDMAIRNVDTGVAQLLQRVGTEAVVVVTSDHGEYFGEHMLVEHSKDVYEPAMRVPLIVRGPGQSEGRVVDTLAVSNDVPGLTAALLPDELRDALAGVFSDLPGTHTVVAENYFSRGKDLFHPEWGHRFRRVRRAVYEWPLKLIDSSDGRHELYDLEADPGELTNLYDRRVDDAARLRAKLEELEKELGRPHDVPDRPPLSPEQRERLEALGYLGG